MGGNYKKGRFWERYFRRMGGNTPRAPSEHPLAPPERGREFSMDEGGRLQISNK